MVAGRIRIDPKETPLFAAKVTKEGVCPALLAYLGETVSYTTKVMGIEKVGKFTAKENPGTCVFALDRMSPEAQETMRKLCELANEAWDRGDCLSVAVLTWEMAALADVQKLSQPGGN